MNRHIMYNAMYSDAYAPPKRKGEIPWHFVPTAPVEVHGTIEYPIIAPLETRAKMKGGSPEDYIIEVETGVAYSVESQMLIAGCLSWMMEVHPSEFRHILEFAKMQSDIAGENNFEEI